MDLNSVKSGIQVKVTSLQTTTGMFIADKHLNCRKLDVVGEVLGPFPGHGGDVWAIRHDNSDEVGAYSFTEFEQYGG